MQIDAYLYMSLLFVLDGDSGACVGADQSPSSCYGVVHFPDSVLIVHIYQRGKWEKYCSV